MALARPSLAQDDRMRVPNPLFGGNTIRVAVGQSSFVGGTPDWSRGFSASVAWESWDPGRGGELGRTALGLVGSFSRLPFSQSRFLEDFNASGIQATSAQSADATLVDVQVTVRVRGPRLWALPSAVIAIGYYNFHPSTVDVQGPNYNSTAKMRTKSGPSASLGAAFDAPYIGRAAPFVEAAYVYGWSSDSQLRLSASASCGGNLCDTFKSTQTVTARAGLRVRVGR